MKCEWNETDLGEIVSLTIDHRGLTPKKLGGDWAEKGYRALSAKNIKTGKIVQTESIRFVDEEMYHRWMPDEINFGDIIVTSEAPFGEIYQWNSDEKIVLSQRLFGLRVSQCFDADYIYYYMTTKAFKSEMHARATGTTVIGLRQPELLKCRIKYPNMNNQKKIASILRSFDRKIETNMQINDNLLQQARALFQQYLDSASGTLFPLSAIADINKNTYSPKDEWDYINYLDTSSITSGSISDIQYIDPCSMKVPSRARRILKQGDIVYSTVRPNQLHYGIISDPLPNMLGSTGFAVISSNNPSLPNELIYLALTTPSFIEQMQQLAEQSVSTFPSIRPADLDACTIPIPTEDNMDIVSAIKACISGIGVNNSENKRLSSLRDALLPKLMSGELDVSNIDL